MKILHEPLNDSLYITRANEPGTFKLALSPLVSWTPKGITMIKFNFAV